MAQTVSELIKKAKTIEIRAKRASDEILFGQYKSAFKGRGMEFDGVREYQFGDDIRHIDWNITARYSTPFVKVFEEEKTLNLLIGVDISGSMAYGSGDVLKKEKIAETIAMIAYSALKNQDTISLLLFSHSEFKFVPPRSGKSHILRLIHELLAYIPKNPRTNIVAALNYVNKHIPQKSIFFLISDFNATIDEKILQFTLKKHDLIAMCVKDTVELLPSNIGLIPVKDMETGQLRYINTSSPTEMMEYYKVMNQSTSQWKSVIVSKGGSWLDLTSEDNHRLALIRLFKQRAMR